MKLLPTILAGIVVAALGLAPVAATAQDTRNETVRFDRGSSGTTINGSIRGDQSVNYRLAVSAGQRMSVQLDTDNTSNYFNITAPGASAALFTGSLDGNSASVVIPSSGTYVISVYLMRNAARRNERANYSLTVYVEANAAQTRPSRPAMPMPMPAVDAVAVGDMPRFCTGEASAEYGVRPQSITTNTAYRSGDRYVSQGWYDQNGSTTFFNCWFSLDGQFVGFR